jgi:hypothetical protein
VTAVALLALAIASVARLESDDATVGRAGSRLITERDRLSGRIACLKAASTICPHNQKQAAATAAVLAAKENPPAPSTKTQAASPPAANANKDTTASIPPNPLPKADPTPSAVPMPPARIANASAVENDQPAPKQAEFGLDLGGGATIDGVRLRWITVKANFGPLLSGLRPLATRDYRGGATGYRLTVGPLPNSAAATGLCAHFAAARTACRAVKFEGEQIGQQ